MKTTYRELLLEIIHYDREEKRATNHLDKVIDELKEYEDISTFLGIFIKWLDPSMPYIKRYNQETLSLYIDGLDNEYIINGIKSLFKYCSLFNEIFVLDKTHLKFREEITKETRTEMENFMSVNYKRKIISMYIREDKNK